MTTNAERLVQVRGDLDAICDVRRLFGSTKGLERLYVARCLEESELLEALKAERAAHVQERPSF